MKVGELCAGYGGIGLGLTLAGEDVDLRWLAEFDPALDPLHPPSVPNLGDITKVDWSTVERVDLLTAGFPCQPVSAAGNQLAEADPRWLWPAVRDTIAALLPDRVLLENVRNLVSMRKGEIWAYILSDLNALGYDVRWLTLGACAVGAAHHRHRVFALAQRGSGIVRRLDVAECGAPRGSVMVPTATTIDAKDSRNQTAQRGAAGRVGPVRHSLESMARLDLLPTPAARDGDHRGVLSQGERKSPNLGTEMAALFPTPQARDGQGRGTPDGQTASARWDAGRRNLDDGLALLPTPSASSASGGRRDRAPGPDGRITRPSGESHGISLDGAVQHLLLPRASDGVNGGPGQRGSSGDLALPSATQPQHWGRFANAVARHASVFGPPPPPPTEPNRNGAPRLSAVFAEWLMCIPPGHVTGVLPRRDALKAIGNGVCPPQLAAAWR